MNTQSIQFVKMHGLGNDFMVIDAVRQSIHLNNEQIKRLGNRHFGVGFDQLLLVEPCEGGDADFRYRIFNADGNEVEHCGNGARCFARFVYDQGLTAKKTIPVMTMNGRIVLQLQDDGLVTVNMGQAELSPELIPFISESRQTLYTLQVAHQVLELSAISVGNPHAVLRVDDVDTAPVATLGAALESHAAFPRRVNVGFMQILSAHHIRLRVFERGVGETQACGTGACAAVIAGRLQGALAEQVQVDLRGGSLHIEWKGEGSPIMMTGPTETVFAGTLTI